MLTEIENQIGDLIEQKKTIDKKIRELRKAKKAEKILKYTNRAEEIIRLRSEGYTFNEIGEIYGISGNRVRQIFGKEDQRKSRIEKFGEIATLSSRVFRALNLSNIKSKEHLIECLEDEGGVAIVKNNFGDTAIMELEDFVGFKIDSIGYAVCLFEYAGRAYERPCVVLRKHEFKSGEQNDTL